MNNLDLTLPILSTKKQKSITEQYSPIYRRKPRFYFQSSLLNVLEVQNKPSIQESRKQLLNDIEKVNKMIDSFDEYVRNRLQVHEVELLMLVKSQIDKIVKDVEIVVYSYNQVMKKKNQSEEIWKLTNQLDFYHQQLDSINSQNIQLRHQNQVLKREVQKEKNQNYEMKEALKSVMKKLLKYKNRSQKFMTQVSLEKNQSEFKNLSQKKSTNTLDKHINTIKKNQINKSNNLITQRIKSDKIKSIRRKNLISRSNINIIKKSLSFNQELKTQKKIIILNQIN